MLRMRSICVSACFSVARPDRVFSMTPGLPTVRRDAELLVNTPFTDSRTRKGLRCAGKSLRTNCASPLITPSTGEAEPRGSSCILYAAYNTFCTIHIRNVLNATIEWTSGVCGTVQVVQSIFLPFPLSYIHGEKTPPARRPRHDIAMVRRPHHHCLPISMARRRRKRLNRLQRAPGISSPYVIEGWHRRFAIFGCCE